jgi:tRNA-splicing ligase RtcB
MNKVYAYHQKHVRDLDFQPGLARVWSPEIVEREEIVLQIKQLCRLPFVQPYVAVMPDCHPGETALVGSVVPTRDMLLLGAIGGDIGCGMSALKLPLQMKDIEGKLEHLLGEIYRSIPVGGSRNTQPGERVRAMPIWERAMRAPLLTNRRIRMLRLQMGSLGGGNHFIEIQRDSEGCIWAMVHTGSRGLGTALRDFYTAKASALPGVNPSLFRRCAYLPAESDLGRAYMDDLQFAVHFAAANRREIMTRLLEALRGLASEAVPATVEDAPEELIDVFHNGIWKERHFEMELFVHRKGATPAHAGRMTIIPGSMGNSSFIVEGKGNPFSFCSVSHGAGRMLSRSSARRTITREQLEESMAGVAARLDDRHIEEAPAAYKDIHRVMRCQRDLVKVRVELSPILSVKG